MNIGFYNKTVIIITITILIILSFFLGIYLYFNYYDNYPNIVSDCPPNWDISYVNNDTLYCIEKNYNLPRSYLGNNNNNNNNFNIFFYNNCKLYPIHEFR